METETPLHFRESLTREECQLATLVGLCLAKRVLYVVPSGEELWQPTMAIDRAIKDRDHFDHELESRAWEIASNVTLPALDNKKHESPLTTWSDAIWRAIIDAREEA